MIPFQKVLSMIDKHSLTNVHYLVNGITEGEKLRYFKEVLKIEPKGKHIIVDDSFFNLITGGLGSEVLIYEGDKLTYNKYLSNIDAIDWTLLKKPEFSIALLDTITMQMPSEFGGFYKTAFADTRLVNLSKTYQSLTAFDLTTGTFQSEIKVEELQLNIEQLLTKALTDTTVLNYALRERAKVGNFFEINKQFPELEAVNITSCKNRFSVWLYLSYLTTSGGVDKLPFMLSLNEQLEVLEVYPFDQSGLPKDYYINPYFSNHFNHDEGRVYCKLSYSFNGQFDEVESSAVFRLRDDVFTMERLTGVHMPKFFKDKKVYGNYNTGGMAAAGNDVVIYFMLTPCIYSLEHGYKTHIEGTRYKKTKLSLSDPRTNKYYFAVKNISITDNGSLLCTYIDENKRSHIEYISTGGKSFKKSILFETTPIATQLHGDQLRFLIKRGERYKIYTYSFSE